MGWTSGARWHSVLVLTWLAALAMPACPAGARDFAWPAGKRSAVCLTYDDGLKTQLDHAIPRLDARGFKATFFLRGDVPESDFKRWAAAAANGHELGNHSFTHPCYSSYAFVKATGNAVDQYTPEQMTGDIARMNEELSAIDGQPGPRSYAYPCYNRALIDGYFGMTPLADGSSAIEAVRNSGLISCARGGDTQPVVTDSEALDFMYVPSVMFAGGSVDGLLTYIDEAHTKGGLVVISLHGIGGESLSTPFDEHEKLLDALAARTDLWVAPFGEVMRHVQQTRETHE